MKNNINTVPNSSEQIKLIEELLEGNFYENYINMSTEEIKNIDWDMYKKKMEKKIDEILTKEETKNLFKKTLQLASNKNSVYTDNNIYTTIVDALQKMNIFWDTKGDIENTYRLWNQIISAIDSFSWDREEHIYEITQETIKKALIKEINVCTKDGMIAQKYNKLKNGKSVFDDNINKEVHNIDELIWIYNKLLKMDEWIYNIDTSTNQIYPKASYQNIYRTIKILSVYISVADEEDKKEFEKILDKNRELYEKIENNNKKIIEKQKNTITGETNSWLWWVIIE